MAFTDPFQLILVLGIVAVLMIWGPSKIPQLAKSLGEAKREFQRGTVDTGQPSPPLTTPTSYQTNQRETNYGANSDDDLLKVARTLNIPTEGKDRKQIAEEISWKLKTA